MTSKNTGNGKSKGKGQYGDSGFARMTTLEMGWAEVGAGDLYWSLALLWAGCAGDSRAGTRKINGQMRCLRTGLRLDWSRCAMGPGRLRAGLEAEREVKVAGPA
jgi:hypothetical protein